MPLFILVVGILLIDSGFHGKSSEFFSQLKSDFVGFLAFGAVILILGGLGAIKTIRPVSQGLLVLVFVVFFLRNGKNIADNLKSSATSGPIETASSAPVTASPSSNSLESSVQSLSKNADYIEMIGAAFGG